MVNRAFLKSLYLASRSVFLHGLRLLIRKTDAQPHMKEGLHILFIRTDRIGDLVLSTPALRAIKTTFPSSELTVLASSVNNSVIDHNPHVDRVIVYKGLIDWTIRMKRARAHRYYDVVIDPYQDYELKTALIAFLSGARLRIGYSSYGREVFFDLGIPKTKTPRHFVDVVLEALKPIGIETQNRVPEIFLSEEERAWSKDWMDENRIGGKPVIGIHPGAFYPSQRWPSEYFSELFQNIQRDGKQDVIVFGGNGDKELIQDIISPFQVKPHTFAHSDLRLFMALLSRCRLLICNNSGPLHIATGLGIPTLSFMGPTVKDVWMPVGDCHKVLRMDDLPCIGCNRGYCKIKTHDCMKLITPSVVIDHIRRIHER